MRCEEYTVKRGSLQYYTHKLQVMRCEEYTVRQGSLKMVSVDNRSASEQ